jgi:outer membrane protein assembly factor BamE (lipoprotein component of BamABCDE complex)
MANQIDSVKVARGCGTVFAKKAASIAASLFALALVGCASPSSSPSKFTESNVALIHKGMTPDDVTAIFGPPDSVERPQDLVYTFYLYNTGSSEKNFFTFLNKGAVLDPTCALVAWKVSGKFYEP